MKLCNNEIIINFVLQRYAVYKPKKSYRYVCEQSYFSRKRGERP
jgi:hypothetical protein